MSATSILDLTEMHNKQLEDTTSAEITVNTQNADANNETVISIEDEGEKLQVELLKDAVCTDQGLHAVSYRDCKSVQPTYLPMDYGFRKEKRPIWVQFNREESGTPMDEDARGPFIRLVFAILFICLLITLAFATCTFVIPGVRDFFAPLGLVFAITGSFMVVAVSYILAWSTCGRTPPCNFIALFVAIVGECFIFGGITAKYALGEILIALAITCIVVIICFCLAFTPLDFTKCYIYVIVIGAGLGMLSLVVFGLRLAGYQLVWLRLGLAACLIVFISFSLIMELQLILGGKTMELGEDDYVLGAFLLYTSIMSLFFQILQIIGILDEL